jgi:transcription elongation factor Elf1
MVEPTVLMVRVVLEHQPPKEKVFALANTFICPKCGSTLECASATNMIKENPPRAPIAGDISLCMDCGELLEFTATNLILLAEERFHELQIKHQVMLREAQAFVRKRVSRPDKAAPDRPSRGEVPPEPGRA